MEVDEADKEKKCIASQQFRESEAYQKLPETEEDLKKAKKSDSPMEDPGG